MSELIEEAMDYTKEKASENREAHVLLSLAPQAYWDVYLAVEYCENAWHLGLETPKECVGEIVRKGGSFIEMLNDREVEAEKI